MRIIIFFFLITIVVSENIFSNQINKLRNIIFNKKTTSQKNDTILKEKIFAVLVAGSKNYINYRHQADVCNVYQILHKFHEIPKENIIVFMYDDIAYHELNPFKGNIINRPEGENLYKNINIDYRHNEVNSENFIKVLLGNENLKKSGKKVLNSTKDDNVFIYFSDHGAPHLIQFPNDYLLSKKLNDVFIEMNKKKLYNKMVFYLESCDSGSMFNKILNSDLNIFAVTGSKPNEVTHACYYDDKRSTYLADNFSSKLFNDLIKNDSNTKTLYDDYEILKNTVNTSHVSWYGNLEVAKSNKLSNFIGINYKRQDFNKSEDKQISIVSNYDVPLKIFEFKLMKNETSEKEREYYLNKLKEIKNSRKFVDKIMKKLAKKISSHLKIDFEKIFHHKKDEISDHLCYERLIDIYHKNCFALNQHSYVLRYLYIFVNSCEYWTKSTLNMDLKSIEQLLIEECSKSLNKPFLNIE